MNSLEDHQVDRTEVYRRISKGLELTVTNRVNDFFVLRVCFAIIELPIGTWNRARSVVLITTKFFPGDHSGRATPVPIPNTAVKPARADDSPKGESRSLPGFFSESARVARRGLILFRWGAASGLAPQQRRSAPAPENWRTARAW